jgi:hypothetical protein
MEAEVREILTEAVREPAGSAGLFTIAEWAADADARVGGCPCTAG